MKNTGFIFRFLWLLIILALQGCGEKTGAISSEKTSGMEPDTNPAIRIFNETKALAERGDAKAQFYLGNCYAKGDVVATNYEEAIKWYRKASEQNHPEAQCKLGNCYEYGIGTETDGAEALKWYRKAADQNVADAQYSLGVIYSTSYSTVNIKDVLKDDAEAAKWFKKAFELYNKAAEQGDADSETRLSWMYFKGEGIAQNNDLAVKWLRKAAEQGDAKKQGYVGFQFYNGFGVPQDYVEAAKWYRKAAERGDVDSQMNLSLRYYSGEGVPKDFCEAAKWCRMAAEKGDAMAQDTLGQNYSIGQGVPMDFAEAAKWFRKAAEQGDAEGQIHLGRCYFDGKGVPRDYVEAYKWFNLASASSASTPVEVVASYQNEQAKEYLKALEKMMTPEQIAEGQHRSSAFIARAGTSNSGSDNSSASENPTASGTGFFITNDGYLISNYHVVKDAAKVRLLTSAGLIDATVVKVDAANDLALLKATGKFSPLPIAASRPVKLGATVATVGFPDTGLQGFSPKLAKGEIGSLAGAADDPRYFQISVPVQHGNSGGALVDVRGNVVGIVAARLGVEIGKAVTSDELPENVNYAVKSSLLLSFLESEPDVASKIKEPNTKDEPFEDVVKSAQDAAVLVLVY